MITAGCDKMQISAESFEWVYTLQPVLSQLGSVFNVYCYSRKLFSQSCLLSEKTPQEITNCQWEDVRNYFQWIRKVQDILGIWQNKFLKNNVNYDEILMYASNSEAINSLGRAVCATDYVMDVQDVGRSEENVHFLLRAAQLLPHPVRP